MTHQYFGILVAHLYQNRFKVQEHELQKALVTRDHGASGKETKKRRAKQTTAVILLSLVRPQRIWLLKTLF